MGRLINLTTGNDTFTQSSVGANAELVIRSFAGDDIIRLDRSDDLGGGNDVATGAGKDAVISSKEFGNFITLGAGNDTYVGLGFGSFGTDLIDQVAGGTGNDTIVVQTFHSHYFGNADNDIFLSVGWQNSFHGGSGIDTISYQPRVDDTTVGSTGVLVNLRDGFAQTGGNHQETLVSIENIIGSANGDTLIGSNGANRITGGQGFDDLLGLGGADVFVFNGKSQARVNAEVAETIEDFSHAQHDKIDLHAMDANSTRTGNQAFHFITGSFTGHAAELRFNGQFISGDVNGDGRADFRVQLINVATMGAADFVL